ncbi:hypothetical protein T07_5788 [Trichinella nelsoni]|uniref:Uncharacterized protein n=1 Tax=Trichinella nelsoni TaxID=6336 RepID=A0A0V0RW96_9BILA|nr:hypothetical protein T07_9004 [Trichinella nelsoni]KRX20483.1 hypothetical protein T07_5788 [Trichinella nelsoni]
MSNYWTHTWYLVEHLEESTSMYSGKYSEYLRNCGEFFTFFMISQEIRNQVPCGSVYSNGISQSFSGNSLFQSFNAECPVLLVLQWYILPLRLAHSVYFNMQECTRSFPYTFGFSPLTQLPQQAQKEASLQ